MTELAWDIKPGLGPSQVSVFTYAFKVEKEDGNSVFRRQ
jgi:hypothetical protein